MGVLVADAGQAVLAESRTRSRHLAPSLAPSWATYGVAGAAMGVALYGTAAIWAADPAFAGAAGLYLYFKEYLLLDTNVPPPQGRS